MQLSYPTRDGSAVDGVRKLPVPRGLGSTQVSLSSQQSQASSCIHPCLCRAGADSILGTRGCHPSHTNAGKTGRKRSSRSWGSFAGRCQGDWFCAGQTLLCFSSLVAF